MKKSPFTLIQGGKQKEPTSAHQEPLDQPDSFGNVMKKMLRGPDHKAIPVDDLRDETGQAAKEILDEQYTHVEAELLDKTMLAKLKSNSITTDLEIGQAVSINGKIYRVIGDGCKTAPDGKKIATICLTAPEVYADHIRRYGGKNPPSGIIDLDQYFL